MEQQSQLLNPARYVELGESQENYKNRLRAIYKATKIYLKGEPKTPEDMKKTKMDLTRDAKLDILIGINLVPKPKAKKQPFVEGIHNYVAPRAMAHPQMGNISIGKDGYIGRFSKPKLKGTIISSKRITFRVISKLPYNDKLSNRVNRKFPFQYLLQIN